MGGLGLCSLTTGVQTQALPSPAGHPGGPGFWPSWTKLPAASARGCYVDVSARFIGANSREPAGWLTGSE